MEQRISPAIAKLAVSFVPAEQRPDFKTRWLGDPFIYRLKDAWTTHSQDNVPMWDCNPNDPYAVPTWARADYLFPMSDPRCCLEAGGDHNIFILTLNQDGSRIFNPTEGRAAGMFAWHDYGLTMLAKSDAELANLKGQNLFIDQPAKASGWANVPINGTYYPPTPGPWWACPWGMGDLTFGFGMPANTHLSLWLVYQRVNRSTIPPVDPTDPGGTADLSKLEAYAAQIAADTKRCADAMVALARHMGAAA